MSTCPYCLTKVDKENNICDNCGAEKGYVSMFSRVRGAFFVTMWGIFLPLTLGVILVILVDSKFLNLTMALFCLSVILLSVYKLTSGAAWYR